MNIRNIDQLLKPETTLVERAIILRALRLAHGVIEEYRVFPEQLAERGAADLKPFFSFDLDQQLEQLEALASGDVDQGISTFARNEEKA
jgi:hypothetical protein